jgi:hypothetical protein
MKEAIKELTFSLMQRGPPMQTREALHPMPDINLSSILSWTSRKKEKVGCNKAGGGG